MSSRKRSREPSEDPKIIAILRTLRNRKYVPAEQLASVDAEVDALLEQWHDNESPRDISIAFGLRQKRRGARRKLRIVLEECWIAQHMVEKAWTGINVSTFSAAVSALEPFPGDSRAHDVKRVERAWKLWGQDYIDWLREPSKPDMIGRAAVGTNLCTFGDWQTWLTESDGTLSAEQLDAIVARLPPGADTK